MYLYFSKNIIYGSVCLQYIITLGLLLFVQILMNARMSIPMIAMTTLPATTRSVPIRALVNPGSKETDSRATVCDFDT